jgi:hypothetical protein
VSFTQEIEEGAQLMATRLMGLGALVFLVAGGPVRPLAAQITAQPDPGTLQKLRGENGKRFSFAVTGNANGAVWGTGIYTDDSTLAAAAVHAGVLKNGQEGIVKVTILPDQGTYQGSERNGVKTGSWNAHGGSYLVEAVGRIDAKVRPDPGNLEKFRDQSGTIFIFEVTGKADGGGYGTDIYSSDTPRGQGGGPRRDSQGGTEGPGSGDRHAWPGPVRGLDEERCHHRELECRLTGQLPRRRRQEVIYPPRPRPGPPAGPQASPSASPRRSLEGAARPTGRCSL